MSNKKIGFERVREIALAMPGVEESTMYGAPAVKLRKKLLACPAIHRSAEPNTLAVRIDFDQRDELIDEDPSVYYLKDHYLNYRSCSYECRGSVSTRYATYSRCPGVSQPKRSQNTIHELTPNNTNRRPRR